MVFPVKNKYTIGPDIQKYEGPAFNLLTNQSYLLQKKHELGIFRTFLAAQENYEIVKHLADYTHVHSTLIADVALRLEEDVAILHKGKLAAICFCFPSGFSPYKLLNKSFADIHSPVPHNQKLTSSADNISAVISRENQMYRRYVWTLTSLKTLSQFPAYDRPEPKSITDLYFRTETQTTVGLGNDIALFFVKVEMTPLINIWNDKADIIKESLSSMTDEILTYKNLHQIKNILLQQ